MKHKYLNNIGIKSNDTSIFNTTQRIDKDRKRKLRSQKEEHSFDERETWDLDFTSATWIYEHLKMFLDVSKIVDLTFHNFEVPVIYETNISFDEVSLDDQLKNNMFVKEQVEKHTEEDCINIIINYLEKYFHEDNDYDPSKFNEHFRKDRLRYIYLKYAFKIYAEIVGSLWW